MGSEPESVRVNAVVSESQREKWKNHVEQSGEYSSLSDLIRTGVEREIQGRESNGSGEESIQTGEILDKLDELGSRFNSVESRLSSLESESKQDPEIGQLATEIYGILPDKEPGSDGWEMKRNDLKDELEAIEEGYINGDSQSVHESLHGWRGTVKGLSNALNEPEYMVQKAIEKLLNDPIPVRETDDGRYYKEE